ncbi:hypothetical protein FUAX_04340 [Fulvitalea axinellae]|uniref:Glycosyltransferase 2-like domain-containing protein n=1 Tax=Fulvitalea axinellae TaxID=1182444 RepID=A0AAU9CRK1_9BACT|nr:hypothetical protein FUAX_04340 [Fulvitalea axinellae]
MNTIIVSVIIVVRNEQKYILECIKSVERQFLGGKLPWELLIVDGESEDKTRSLCEKYLQSVSYNWVILDNPKRTLAPGWNIGIKNASGVYVIRPDAHSTLSSGYIQRGINTLERMQDIVAVGGGLETKAKNYWGDIIKEALSSKVGVGNSSFRTGESSGYVDTAVYGVYRRSVFDDVGYFNEELVRHQDNDMHQRLKSAGWKFYMNADMHADYYCRDTISSLFNQMYKIGRYLPDVMNSGALSLRHFAPFIFYSFIFILMLVGAVSGASVFILGGTILFLSYLIVIGISACLSVFINRKFQYIYLLGIIPGMHINYAIGTMFGLFKKVIK